MSNILLIDFESTGLDTAKERIIEIGAMVVNENWDMKHTLSVLVQGQDYPSLSEEIVRITGITQNMLTLEAIQPEAAFQLLDLVGDVDYAIAFNAPFDKGLFLAEAARQSATMRSGINNLAQVPWLCAMADIETNYLYKSWKLMHLALEYGVTVNPKELHRAINDVELMRQLLVASGTTIKAMLEFNQSPWVVVRAMIPPPWEDGGKGKGLAQGRGYAWEVCKGTTEPRIEKAWVKRIKAHQLDEETKQAPFKVRAI